VQPEDRVAICMERSPEMIVGILGALKAGAAYVPLDPSYPAERLAYMLEDAAPTVLLTEERLIADLPVMALLLISLDAPHSPVREQVVDNPDVGVLGLTPGHPAYVIYTSGSTGLPKGVIVEHRGVCNLAILQQQTFHVQRGKKVLQLASFSFDACCWEWVMALCSGASLVLASRDRLAPGDPLLTDITTSSDYPLDRSASGAGRDDGGSAAPGAGSTGRSRGSLWRR